MGFEVTYDDFSGSEKEQFQKCCRLLLKSTFIVRDKDEDSRKNYFFVSKNSECISSYFSYMGFDLIADRDNGVIMLRSCIDLAESSSLKVNHLRLKKSESMVLCCLWTMYVDRVSSGSLSRSILVSITDLRYELEKYGFKDQIDKSLMAASLSLLSKYNLIDISGKIGEPDCVVKIFPSIQFALDSESFASFAAKAMEKMQQKKGDSVSDEEDEDDK